MIGWLDDMRNARIDRGKVMMGQYIGGLIVTGLAERVAQPFETLVETVTRGSAGGLNILKPKVRR